MYIYVYILYIICIYNISLKHPQNKFLPNAAVTNKRPQIRDKRVSRVVACAGDSYITRKTLRYGSHSLLRPPRSDNLCKPAHVF